MKKKLSLVLAMMALMLALVCVFASCNNDDVANHTHDYGEWEITKDATCTTDGSKERCCTCGEKQTASISATGHTIVSINAIEASCTSDGYTDGKSCSTCGEIIIAPQKIAASHKYNDGVITQEASCTEDGIKTYTCSACNNNYTETIKGGHNWNDATCTEAKTCSKCNTTSGDALGHTCVTGICSRCKQTVYPNIQILNSFPTTISQTSYYDNKTYTTVRITDASYEFDDRGNLVITFTFEKIYDYKGDFGTTTINFNYELTDQDGYSLKAGSFSKSGMCVGDKAKATIKIVSGYLENGNFFVFQFKDKQG